MGRHFTFKPQEHSATSSLCKLIVISAQMHSFQPQKSLYSLTKQSSIKTKKIVISVFLRHEAIS